MTGVRAFVGHSFNAEDEEIVRKFLTHFETLAKSKIDFVWEHAEGAESKILAEKVMSLISDKNVFIGICTKKEFTISLNELKSPLLRRNLRIAEKKMFERKTSDWIIQEIGLAIGRGLRLILLVESDVRLPGGLQGDIEFIRFERKFPERSFDKILEMITSISPRVSDAPAASADMNLASTKDEPGIDMSGGDSLTTPRSDWKRLDYERAYWLLAIDEDEEGIVRIDGDYLNTDDASNDSNKISWQAYTELVHLEAGNGESFAKLEALARANPENIIILKYLAAGQRHYQDHTKAAATYEAAAAIARNDKEAIQLKGLAAEEYVRADLLENSSAIIDEIMKDFGESGNEELQTLQVLSDLAKLGDEIEANLAYMERIVELDPSDIDTRFSLAHLYAKCGNDDLALLHYLKIPYQQRGSATWNNLGVTFENLSMPAKSVNAYRKAKAKGETLAMSNLANKYISAGLLTEARDECNEAMTFENYHKNIGSSLTRLTGVPDQEDDTKAERLEKAKPKSDFYKKFGRAASHPDMSKLATRWEGPDCILEVTVNGQIFSATGSYEAKHGLMAAALLGVVAGELPRFRIEYTGTVRGRSVEARVTRKQENKNPANTSVLGSSTDENKVIMVLTDDKDEISVMEYVSEVVVRYYTLKRSAIGS
ncbi:MAG: hypothetical protein HQ502_01880 [Alphaproteobacteria bacterium]|nr:hypothetical protein [Alphaproteobacteria bacterium]